jgi:signal transduction histidine kinase
LTEELEIWRPAAESAGIELVLRVAEGLVAVAGEHDLRQLVGILLDNAIKYAGRGATVVLAGARVDSTLEITVSDDGPGLSAEELQTATQRFWRGGVAGPGTGLGLAIAEQTALAIGGRLELSSSQPSGLTATIRLLEAT